MTLPPAPQTAATIEPVALSECPPRVLRRVAAWIAVAAMAAITVTMVAVTRPPASCAYREVVAGPVAEQAARSFVSRISALHADFIREGDWEAAFTQDELNAWLAIDLPRNHPAALPSRVLEPRVGLRPRRVQMSARLALAGLRPVVLVELGVRLREPNQVTLTVEDAGLGAIPLPHGPILTEIRGRLNRLGMVTALQRLDGRSVLVVYIPSTHESGGMSHWLESLSVTDGGVVVAGRTLAARDTAGR